MFSWWIPKLFGCWLQQDCAEWAQYILLLAHNVCDKSRYHACTTIKAIHLLYHAGFCCLMCVVMLISRENWSMQSACNCLAAWTTTAELRDFCVHFKTNSLLIHMCVNWAGVAQLWSSNNQYSMPLCVFYVMFVQFVRHISVAKAVVKFVGFTCVMGGSAFITHTL